MEPILHKAKIIKIGYQTLWVSLQRDEACSGCALQSACNIKKGSQQIYKIAEENVARYHLGQEIMLELTQKSGFLAIFWAYLLPLVLMLSTLLIVYEKTEDDLMSGFSSIIILIPYYFLIFFNQKYFNQKFNFKIITK